MAGEGIELIQVSEGKLTGRNSGVQPNLTTLAVTAGDTFTQTYSTAQTTVPAATYAATASAVATTAATNSSPYGFVGAAQADALVATANANRTDIIALAADVLALKKVITAIIDNLQTHRLVG